MVSIGIERGRHRAAGYILIIPLWQVGTSLAPLEEKYHLGGALRLARRASATGQDSPLRQRLSGPSAGCCSTLCRHGK
jgi:hypothetical protein